MNFILFSHTQIGAIPSVAGHTQYPYDLVLKACQPVLERLGRVHVVQSTAEVDPLYRQLQEQGQDGLFLSFAPVHETAADLRCPTLCVVAWEFDSIPDEPWDDDPAHDWRQLLGRHGRAITLSEHTAGTVRKAMGEDFPILVLPAMLGQTLGVAVQDRLDQSKFRRWTQILLVLTGLNLMRRAMGL